MSQGTSHEPGWYPDPAGGPGTRWWDGAEWSDRMGPPAGAPVNGPAPGHGMAVAALVCGIVGVVIGLIPILGIGALALGLVAIVLGFISWRRGKAAGRRQGRAGIVLGIVAIVLSVIGLVIVSNAFDNLEDDLDCLERADTAAEIEAC